MEMDARNIVVKITLIKGVVARRSGREEGGGTSLSVNVGVGRGGGRGEGRGVGRGKYVGSKRETRGERLHVPVF